MKHSIKTFVSKFQTEHHQCPKIFNATCRFHILDALSVLKKSVIWYSFGGGARGAYLAHGLICSWYDFENYQFKIKAISPWGLQDISNTDYWMGMLDRLK